MNAKSLNNKIAIAYKLAIRLSERLNNNSLHTNEEEMIWAHADGLRAKRLYSLRNGWCSLLASLSFDIEWEEKKLDKDITTMQNLCGEQCKIEIIEND